MHITSRPKRWIPRHPKFWRNIDPRLLVGEAPDADVRSGREDFFKPYYFLFGTSDQTGENDVYIGQAGVRKNGDGILLRLQEHKRNQEKDYWTGAVVFTTSNNSFGPTEISYLENRFCNLATESKRYIVKNENDPTSGNVT